MAENVNVQVVCLPARIEITFFDALLKVVVDGVIGRLKSFGLIALTVILFHPCKVLLLEAFRLWMKDDPRRIHPMHHPQELARLINQQEKIGWNQ